MTPLRTTPDQWQVRGCHRLLAPATRLVSHARSWHGRSIPQRDLLRIMSSHSPRVAAIVRQLQNFDDAELNELLHVVLDFGAPVEPSVRAMLDDEEARHDALTAMHAVADALDLEPGRAPTIEEFNKHPKRGEWTARRIASLFGSWGEAARRFASRRASLNARQVAHLRAARKGVFRERDDYLNCVSSWLRTDPPSKTTDDYDRWQREYNLTLPPGEQPTVSYSMLRKALPWDWETTKHLAGDKTARKHRRRAPATHKQRHGPNDLIAFGDVQTLLGLSTTAARSRTYADAFPPPAYTQPRPPGTRFWRRSDIEAHLNGHDVPQRAPNDLQDTYLDVHAVAEKLGLARITVTTGSSPRVPDPAVVVAGIQLWLAYDIRGERPASRQ